MRNAFLVVLAACALAACGKNSDTWPQTRFDHEAWVRTDPAARFVMVRDLMDRGLLVGLTSGQVKTLLGKPSFDSPEYMTYVVKADSGVLTILDLRFGASQKVEKVLLRTD